MSLQNPSRIGNGTRSTGGVEPWQRQRAAALPSSQPVHKSQIVASRMPPAKACKSQAHGCLGRANPRIVIQGHRGAEGEAAVGGRGRRIKARRQVIPPRRHHRRRRADEEGVSDWAWLSSVNKEGEATEINSNWNAELTATCTLRVMGGRQNAGVAVEEHLPSTVCGWGRWYHLRRRAFRGRGMGDASDLKRNRAGTHLILFPPFNRRGASLIILHVKTAKKQLSQDGEGKERAKRTSTPPNRTLRFGNIEIISSTIELQWRGLQDELDARIREFEDTRHN
ncbi:hypothetical protein C8J57DRAFT_1557790 [Mycena rebaudengoi]|nr:hypothetical protein C8J57DRAFT_1257549 [Mycena rebaudengoi]KAJ7242507.1 hypothetical protein C8J57DRAFT_1557790 [Mycena rebaudengoi]